MRRPRFLFDASSLVRALREARLQPLAGEATQWLAFYEVLNAFWKMAVLLKLLTLEEAGELAALLSELTGYMVILEPKGLEREILEAAASTGTTAYDASYIVLARRHGLTLVTEDKRLRRAARGIVEAVSLDDL